MMNKNPYDRDVGEYKEGRHKKSLCRTHLSHQQNLKDGYIVMAIFTYVGTVNLTKWSCLAPR